jgi:hypothetical protein
MHIGIDRPGTRISANVWHRFCSTFQLGLASRFVGRSSTHPLIAGTGDGVGASSVLLGGIVVLGVGVMGFRLRVRTTNMMQLSACDI